MENIATTLITATLGGGGAVALIGLVRSLFEKATGRADKERHRNKETMDDFKTAVREAEADADRERALRIATEEELSYVTQLAVMHGVPREEIRKFRSKE